MPACCRLKFESTNCEIRNTKQLNGALTGYRYDDIAGCRRVTYDGHIAADRRNAHREVAGIRPVADLNGRTKPIQIERDDDVPRSLNCQERAARGVRKAVVAVAAVSSDIVRAVGCQQFAGPPEAGNDTFPVVRSILMLSNQAEPSGLTLK